MQFAEERVSLWIDSRLSRNKEVLVRKWLPVLLLLGIAACGGDGGKGPVAPPATERVFVRSEVLAVTVVTTSFALALVAVLTFDVAVTLAV